MSNQEIVKLLRNMAAALIIKGANRFRVIAYEKAADSIEHLTSEVKDIWDEGKLDEIPGIGNALARHLNELLRTGKVKHFESTFNELSPALFEFLLIPGLGPKRAYQLTKEFHITNPKTAVNQLEKTAREGKIAKIPGWGDESQRNILSAIETYRKGQIKENRMPLPYADTLAEELIVYLKGIPGIRRVDALGSLRRKVATIGDIDLAVSATDSERVIKAFVSYPKVRKVIDRGPKGATVLLGIGRQVDLRVQSPSAYGAMLQYFTGGKNHNIRLREFALKQGFSLNEHGIKQLDKIQKSRPKADLSQRPISPWMKPMAEKVKIQEFETEEAFYKFLGLSWIPPELREDSGEIEAAMRHKLPQLVEVKDIKGDLHLHSNFDLKPSHDLGTSTLEELLDKASYLGYEYIGISDHNPKITDQTENKIIDIMKRRKEHFEQIYTSWKKREKKRIQYFNMLEVDIDPQGNLSLPEKAFDYVDAVIISVHSSFSLNIEIATGRILSALSHPKAKIWGHPTTRMLGKREGIDVRWEEIFEFCISKSKALEINSWPERLDLPDILVREAVKQDAKLVINTDSHAVEQMTGIKYGVDVARRGWAEKKDILNTMGYNEFSKWLRGGE